MTPQADDYRNLADGIEESGLVSGAASSWWADIATALRSAADDREKLERLEGALTGIRRRTCVGPKSGDPRDHWYDLVCEVSEVAAAALNPNPES